MQTGKKPYRPGHWVVLGIFLGIFVGIIFDKLALGMIFGLLVGGMIDSHKKKSMPASTGDVTDDPSGPLD